MSREERHFETKIRVLEDTMFRSKNIYEIESIRNELSSMRLALQKIQRTRRA